MSNLHFNINHNVRVKLTKKGLAIHRAEHDELMRRLPGPARWEYKEPNDAEGWSQWQMWELMQTFGAHISMGGELPFSTEILIPLPEVIHG